MVVDLKINTIRVIIFGGLEVYQNILFIKTKTLTNRAAELAKFIVIGGEQYLDSSLFDFQLLYS
jgi:hypothetical protein